jgi:hypothetical protein
MLRELVVQEIRQILGPEPDAPHNSCRKVQLMVPSEPIVWAWTTATPDENVAKMVGPNRGTYKGPPMAAGIRIEFCLQPQQTLWAGAESSEAVLGLIIEYVED